MNTVGLSISDPTDRIFGCGFADDLCRPCTWHLHSTGSLGILNLDENLRDHINEGSSSQDPTGMLLLYKVQYDRLGRPRPPPRYITANSGCYKLPPSQLPFPSLPFSATDCLKPTFRFKQGLIPTSDKLGSGRCGFWKQRFTPASKNFSYCATMPKD